MKALQVIPESGLGGPECCLRVSLLPLRLNIDQVHITHYIEKIQHRANNALAKATYTFVFISQDALFFLKDFFSSMAAGVNPYLPVDPAAEGKSAPCNS